MRELWDRADEIIVVSAAYIEGRAAIARRIAPLSKRRARILLDRLWHEVATVPVDRSLIGLAARAADRHRLRALDALHLAAAVQVGGNLTFATWDHELAAAARAEGLATVPARE
jgi:predicted nucleic acid-binding protein